MAVVNFLEFNAPTKIWSRTSGGIISYPSTVTASVGGPFIVNPIIVPFDPIHETGGPFWRLTEGPNIGFLVSAHSNSLGYGDITVTQDGQPDSYATGIAKINPLAPWRLLIKGMGGETGEASSHMLTFNAETFVWSRTTTGIIKWPHEFEHEAGGPYAVNPIVVPFDPEHETGGSFWRLTEGPFTGFLVSFWSNELSYGDITVETNADFDRGPGEVLAILGPGDVVPLPPTGTGDQPAHLAGASLTYNTPGEMHFTLLVDSPFIDIPQPKRTHYAIEFWDTDNEEWFESFAGWVWDFDATDTEVVFYGIDYLGAFQYTIDERYDPELGIEVQAPNGSKYVEKTIREIVIDQIDYALSRPNSMVGFVVRGDIAPMPYVISAIYSTFKDTLNFVVGLLDSHRAGTGKQTRISVRKIDGVYTVIVEDDPGVDRNNLLIQYGGLAQGYRAIPFGIDWASRVNFIGRNKEGLKVMYRADSSAVDQGLYGRIAGAPVYMDTEDYNDMKRRTLQAAIDASRIGRQISVGLKLGSFRPLEGYDICDNLPLDINHGAVTTKDWGSDDFGIDPPDDPSGVMASFWTILGISWESYDDGHWMTGLTLYPRGKRPISQDLELCGFNGACQRFNTGYSVSVDGCVDDGDTVVVEIHARGASGLGSVQPEAWNLAASVDAYDAGQYPGPGPGSSLDVFWRTWHTGDSTTLTIQPNQAGSGASVLVVKGGGTPVVESGTGIKQAGDPWAFDPTSSGGILLGYMAFQRNDAWQQIDGFEVLVEGDGQTVDPAGASHEETCGVTWSPRRWVGSIQGTESMTLEGTLFDPGGQENHWGWGWISLYFENALPIDGNPLLLVPPSELVIGEGPPS